MKLGIPARKKDYRDVWVSLAAFVLLLTALRFCAEYERPIPGQVVLKTTSEEPATAAQPEDAAVKQPRRCSGR